MDEKSVKNWFKNPYNVLITVLLISGFIIRCYFLIQTAGQTAWWDEAEYLATAKHWVLDVPYDLNPQRPPLFQLIAAFFIWLNVSEQVLKFFLTVVPSTLLIWLFYSLGKKMYSEKIGIVAAFFAVVSWTFIFWTTRFQPDFYSMVFQISSIICMWTYWKSDKLNYAIYAGIFAALGFYFKVSALLVPISFMIFILFREKLSALKNKGNYYFAASFLIALIPYFIWAQITFGTIFAFSANYSAAVGTPTPFGWYNLQFFYSLTENLFFLLFLVGLVISLKFLLYLDVIFKDKKESLHPDIFGIIVLLVVSAFYIFYIRGTEDRWVFLWMPFIGFFIGKAVDELHKFVDKYAKQLSVGIIVIMLAIAGYMQMQHASELIAAKKDSYLPVQLAGLYLKDISQPGDEVLSISRTQTTYYAERYAYEYRGWTQERFEQLLKDKHPKYLMVSIFENHPEWISSWIDQHQASLVPLKVYYLDQQQTQLALVLYEIKYS